jgi:cobalamin biosynthesis protein CobT
MRRHHALKHKDDNPSTEASDNEKRIDDTSSDESTDSNSSINNVEMKESDADIINDASNESCINDDNGEEADEEIDDEENQYWQPILAKVLKKYEYESLEDLYDDEYHFNNIINDLRKMVSNLLKGASAIENGRIYDAIADEEFRLVDKCKYKEFEAKKIAWFNRRYLVKRLLKDNKEFIMHLKDK